MMLDGINDSNDKTITNGLVLYWDASQLRSYPGSGTTWTDLSGNGNTGTLTNTPTFNSDNGGSIFTSGTNQWVTSNASIGSATDSYTYSVWFKNDNSTEEKYPLVRGRDGSGSGWSLFCAVTTAGRAKASAVPTLPSVVGLDAIGTSTLSLNTWYHITGVWVPNGTLKVYVNGVLETTTSTSGRTSLRTSTVGWNVASPTSTIFTSGYTALAQSYNRALTDAEILNNFNANKSRFGYSN